MLRKIRTILAAVFFALITLLFLDFTGLPFGCDAGPAGTTAPEEEQV